MSASPYEFRPIKNNVSASGIDWHRFYGCLEDPSLGEGFSLGAWGESLTAEFYRSLGHQVLARNIRFVGSEIDLITRVSANDFRVVEVKTRRRMQFGNHHILPLLSTRKMASLKKGFLSWAMHEEVYVASVSIDLVIVDTARQVLGVFADIQEDHVRPG